MSRTVANNQEIIVSKHWKKILGAVVAVVVLVLGGTLIYINFIKDDPPARFTSQSIDKALSPDTTTSPVATDSGTTNTNDSAATAPVATEPKLSGASRIDGAWNVTTASELRYRVKETLSGFDTEGVGKTNAITGQLTLAGTTATSAAFTVDMTTFQSDESRRDGQFSGRIMQVDQFPTGDFKLTSPIDFGAIPADGAELTAQATGDLTLHGVTNSVTFELTAKLANGKIGVLGTIPVLFSDYNIDNPSFPPVVTTADNGLLEFVLVFEKA
jgi:polyisoprenoid-binding protein YceI